MIKDTNTAMKTAAARTTTQLKKIVAANEAVGAVELDTVYAIENNVDNALARMQKAEVAGIIIHLLEKTKFQSVVSKVADLGLNTAREARISKGLRAISLGHRADALMDFHQSMSIELEVARRVSAEQA